MLNTRSNSIWGSNLFTVPTHIRISFSNCESCQHYARIGVKPNAWSRFNFTTTYRIVQTRQNLAAIRRSFPPSQRKKERWSKSRRPLRYKVASERQPLLSITSTRLLRGRFLREDPPRRMVAIGPDTVCIRESWQHVMIWPIFDLRNSAVKTMISTWNYLRGGFFN